MSASKKVGKAGSPVRQELSASTTAPGTDPYLDKVASELHACFRAEAASTVTQQFSAGRQIAAVQDDAKHGEAAVRVLATKVKRPWKALFRMATRARAFDEEVVTAAVAEASLNNYVLRISIFDELLSVDSASDRKCFLEDAITGRWSVRKIRAEIRAGQQVGPSPVPSKVLPQMIKHSKALMGALEALSQSTDGQPDAADRKLALATLTQLTTAINDTSQRLKCIGVAQAAST